MNLSCLNLKRIDNAVECISAYDRRLNITIWNRSCEKKFSIPAEQALGRPLLQLFPAIINDYRVQCLQLAADLGKTFYFPNMTYLYTQPFTLYSQFIHPLKEDGRLVGVINIVRDHPEEEMYTIDDFKKFLQ